jgi:Pentapeptide repeats (8 copies)
MARDPRLTALRRAGWWLAAALALLGILFGAQRLGWHRLTDAGGVAVDALAHAGRLALGAGWLLLLLAAAGLALGLILSGPGGRAAAGSIGCLVSPKGRWVVRFLVAVSLFAGLALAIAVLPPRFTADRHFDQASDELKAQNDVRTTLLQALAGVVLATGAYLTFRQLQHNIQSSREEHDLDRQGQITDRYTKAVDQLGSQQLDMRVGAIYALERIAQDSARDHLTIVDVLCAFVRRRAHQVIDDSPEVLETYRPPSDVQAAVTVISRLHRLGDENGGPRRRSEDQMINLSEVHLERAQLSGAYLKHADLSGAHLRRASLNIARLERAHLHDAHLEGAILISSDSRTANRALAGCRSPRSASPTSRSWQRFGRCQANVCMGRFAEHESIVAPVAQSSIHTCPGRQGLPHRGPGG